MRCAVPPPAQLKSKMHLFNCSDWHSMRVVSIDRNIRSVYWLRRQHREQTIVIAVRFACLLLFHDWNVRSSRLSWRWMRGCVRSHEMSYKFSTRPSAMCTYTLYIWCAPHPNASTRITQLDTSHHHWKCKTILVDSNFERMRRHQI